MSAHQQTAGGQADRRAGHVVHENAKHLVALPGTAFKGADSIRPSDVQIPAGERPAVPTSPSPRTGHLMLDDLRRDLSDRDLAIIASVADFRYLTAKQIEVLHFTRHASPVSAARKARLALERLSGHRILVRLERRVGGIRAGSASFVYGLGPVGQRLLVESGARSRFKEPSPNFLTHTLAIADLAIELQANGCGSGQSIVTEPDCWRSFTSGVFGARETLKPDLSVVTHDGEYEYRWFVEIDLGTESGTAIRKKAEGYVAYLKTGTEQNLHEVFPRVLFVTPSSKRVEFLRSVLQKVNGAPDELFLVCQTMDARRVLQGSEL